MMKRSKLGVALWGALAIALGATARAADDGVTAVAAQAKVAADKRLPPRVFAYLSVPSVTELKSRWNQTQFGKLIEDKALAEFRRDVVEKIGEFSQQVDEKVGMPLEGLLAIPAGELTIAVAQPADSLAVVGLLDFGRDRADVDKLLEKAQAELKEQGAERKTAEFEGTTIVSYTMKGEAAEGDDEADPADATRLAYFIKDTHVAIGSDVALLEAVLARWNGRHEETFAANSYHRYIQERCTSRGGSPVVSWFVDPVGLLTMALTAGAQGDLNAAVALGMLPTLGLDKLKAMGGAMELATSEFDSVSRTFFYVESPTSGLLNVFQFPPRDLAPPRWVGAKTATYYAMNWDVQGAYGAIESLVDTAMQAPGSFKQIVDAIPAQPGAPNVHPKTDFVDQLSGRINVANDFADPDDAKTGRMVVALELKDAAKMKGVLSLIAQTEGFPGKAREFQNESIYEIEQANPATGESVKMAYGVADGQLVFTSDAAALERILRADRDLQPLSETPEYKRVAAHFPEKTSMLGYSRAETAVQGFYKSLRSGDLGMAIPDIDFSKLPAFEEIRGYLSESGNYAVPDKNGALLVEFGLKAAK